MNWCDKLSAEFFATADEVLHCFLALWQGGFEMEQLFDFVVINIVFPAVLVWAYIMIGCLIFLAAVSVRFQWSRRKKIIIAVIAAIIWPITMVLFFAAYFLQGIWYFCGALIEAFSPLMRKLWRWVNRRSVFLSI